MEAPEDLVAAVPMHLPEETSLETVAADLPETISLAAEKEDEFLGNSSNTNDNSDKSILEEGIVDKATMSPSSSAKQKQEPFAGLESAIRKEEFYVEDRYKKEENEAEIEEE